MKKYILLKTLLLMLCLASISEKKAIILAGQSNMGKAAENIRLLMPDYWVINCAVGGTSILTWQPGQDQYNNCLEVTQSAQENGYAIEGIFFYQGERDSPNPEISRSWKRLFYRFVNHFRKDIGINAPVVFAQLGSKPIQDGRRYWNVIKNMQRLSVSETKGLFIIETEDIKPYCPIDGVHFCPEGYAEIAQRFVDEFYVVKGEK